jgi:phosphoglycerol transferase MdoB-like AlkP superfamily enzyme
MINFLKKQISKDELKYFRNYFLIALALNFVIEVLNRSSLFAAIFHLVTNPAVFLYNSLIILLTISIAFLTRRRIFITLIVSGLWLGFAIANAVLLSYRVTPFTAVDLTLFKEALPMIKLYLSGFQIFLIIAGAIVALIAIVLLFIFAPKFKSKVKYIRNAVCMALLLGAVLLFTSLGISTNVLAKNFGNLADAYKDYGFVYCFTNSLINTGIAKPDNYSVETIEEIADETLAQSSPSKARKTPNIIFIQLESLYDVTLMKDYTYSEDPLPNYHALQKKFSNGFLSMPSVGAGTANSEFEVITGMDLDFFGPGEYPYKTILKQTTCESIAYNLKELGYSTHAMHNNDATFYGRNQVFSNLGFDTFTSIEYMHDVELNPIGWAKDNVLIDEIMNTLKATKEQDLIYTVSVQGHGKYPGSEDDFDTPDSAELSSSLGNAQVEKDYSPVNGYEKSLDAITVEGVPEEDRYSFEYYVSQIHEMDADIGKLIEQLSNYDEEVVLVFYGDHLPSLGIENEDLVNNDIYQTSYVIWDNFDLPQIDMDMQAYQLTASVLKRLNIDNGYLTKLHQTESHTDKYLEDLKLLQYDMLYGEQNIYNGKNPYEPTDLKMGVFDIKIKSLVSSGDRILINGDNFTEYSVVSINGEEVPTDYVNRSTLSIEHKDLKEGDTLVIDQADDDDLILSTSEPYIYGQTK